MENNMTGKYKTRRDGGIVYSYTATWTEGKNVIGWASIIRCAGDLKGSPSGTISLAPGASLQEAVQSAVESWIEAGV
jgi:hypothetical protein